LIAHRFLVLLVIAHHDGKRESQGGALRKLAGGMGNESAAAAGALLGVFLSGR